MTGSALIEIYALCHPRTGEVRYIGKAVDTRRRLAGHLRDARRRDTPVYRWIRKLAAQGQSPAAVVVAVCEPGSWAEVERERISDARRAGLRLLNVADGGNEPSCSTAVRAANGRKNARAIHDDPNRRRLWELKRNLGQHLRDGTVTNRTRAKLRQAALDAPELFGEWANLPDREEHPDGSAVRF